MCSYSVFRSLARSLALNLSLSLLFVVLSLDLYLFNMIVLCANTYTPNKTG
jgi:hypothetical protein